MPSAVMKQEKNVAVEVEEPVKQIISVVEKKVRNLEKRKCKLDEYKAKVQGGATISNDQKQAVARYDCVISSLDFAKELQKQFVEIHEKNEKLLKKKLKAEIRAKHNEEVNRVQEVLRLQSLLDTLGSESAQADFKSGANGAVVLSEEKLGQLDELYKLISPSRDTEKSFDQELQAASEHVVCYLEARERPVVGTTYKQLRTLVSEINACGYFDARPSREEPAAAVKDDSQPEPDSTIPSQSSAVESRVAEPTVTAAPKQTAIKKPTAEEVTSAPQFSDSVASAATLSPSTAQQHQQAAAAPVSQALHYNMQDSLPSQASQSLAASSGSNHAPPPPPRSVTYAAASDDDQSFFSLVKPPQERPLTEIVSSVKGDFDFLQDSVVTDSPESAVGASAAHVDPAVVAARPMSSTTATTSQHSHHHTQQAPASSQDAAAMTSHGAYASQAAQAYSTSATLQDQLAQLSSQVQAQEQSESQQHQQVPGSDVIPDLLNAASQYGGHAAAAHRHLVAAPSAQQQQPTPANQFSSQAAHDSPAEQSWGQAAEQSWGSGAAEHNSWVEQTSSGSWADQASHAAAAPGHAPTAWAAAAASQGLSQLGSEPPAPIPMPNETLPGQSLSFSADQAPTSYSQATDDQKSQLNPNANIFSMYSSGGGQDPSAAFGDFDPRRAMGKDAAASGGAYVSGGAVDKDSYQAPGYRSGQSRDYRSGASRPGGMGGPGAGGGRMGGSRGANTGSGMNSYQRGGGGGPRGGSYGGAAARGASGSGGYQQNGGRGGRSGSGMRGGGSGGGPRSMGGARSGARGGYGQRPGSGQ